MRFRVPTLCHERSRSYNAQRLLLIPPSQLLDHARRPRSRAHDLARLWARFASAPTAREVAPAAVAKARRLRVIRREMAMMLSDVTACRGCARGHAEPAGRWDGGRCCSSRTLSVFTREEVATLKLGGTTPRDLVSPDSDHAGCAFRGERGCSLQPEDRPSICLRYICSELREELRTEPRWRRIKRLNRAMLRDFPEARDLLDHAPGSEPTHT